MFHSELIDPILNDPILNDPILNDPILNVFRVSHLSRCALTAPQFPKKTDAALVDCRKTETNIEQWVPSECSHEHDKSAVCRDEDLIYNATR